MKNKVLVTGGAVGTLLGIIAGYKGGFWDELIMRLVDMTYAIPFLLVALVAAVVFGTSLSLLLILLTIFSWDFETDEKFDLVYDDRQQFTKECNKKHYDQMNKILEKGQLYTTCAVYISQKGCLPPAIYFEIDDKLCVQPLREYK